MNTIQLKDVITDSFGGSAVITAIDAVNDIVMFQPEGSNQSESFPLKHLLKLVARGEFKVQRKHSIQRNLPEWW